MYGKRSGGDQKSDGAISDAEELLAIMSCWRAALDRNSWKSKIGEVKDDISL